MCNMILLIILLPKFAAIKLTIATRMTNINNSLTIIRMTAMWHDFYIGLVCQNCFAHSVMVLVELSMMLSILQGSARFRLIDF